MKRCKSEQFGQKYKDKLEAFWSFSCCSQVHSVCDHNGLGCQVLWKMAKLVPYVPLRRRSWMDQSKMSKARLQRITWSVDCWKMIAFIASKRMGLIFNHTIFIIMCTESCHWGWSNRPLHQFYPQVADFVLTSDQKSDASSCGVAISIIGISQIDLVNSFWAGHVGFSLRVPWIHLEKWHGCGLTSGIKAYRHIVQVAMSANIHEALGSGCRQGGFGCLPGPFRPHLVGWH